MLGVERTPGKHLKHPPSNSSGSTDEVDSAIIFLTSSEAAQSCGACLFFPRVRTPCGRCAQVIIERKGNTTDDGEKNTRKPPKSTQPEPQTTNKQKRPEAVSPSSKQCFLCTEVRQVKKDWLRTIYGPEFTTKVCQEGQRTGEEQCEASQRGFVPSKL